MRKPLSLLVLLGSLQAAVAGTTIDPTNHLAWGASLGWLDWRGDTNNGAVIGEYVCSGYLYSANVGWINLGSGAPTNGIYYQNLATNDFGVNQDGFGHLRGLAYAANIGWINFESNGVPAINLITGKFSGYAYSANCGWISLSNSTAFVQTDSIKPGADANHDGLPDAWELQNFLTISVDPNDDPDLDGLSNLEEYLAGTNPNDPASVLKITGYHFSLSGTNASLTWNSVANRSYLIQETAAIFSPTNWLDSGLGNIPATGISTTSNFTNSPAPFYYFRIQAIRPLTPQIPKLP